MLPDRADMAFEQPQSELLRQKRGVFAQVIVQRIEVAPEVLHTRKCAELHHTFVVVFGLARVRRRSGVEVQSPLVRLRSAHHSTVREQQMKSEQGGMHQCAYASTRGKGLDRSCAADASSRMSLG